MTQPPHPELDVAPLADVEALALDIAPPRDLFSDIHARIAPRPRIADYITRFRVALVALSAVGATALVLLVVRPAPPSPAAEPGDPVASSEGPSVAALAGDVGLDAALQTYRDAGDQLLRALKARRANIPDAVWRDIETSLADVDRALAEIKTVMDQSPDDPQLLSFALNAHAQRVAVLSRLVRTFPLS